MQRIRVDVRMSRELKKLLEEMADRERRSTNAQIELLLALGVQSYRPTLKEAQAA
jgi:hypothetical protein